MTESHSSQSHPAESPESLVGRVADEFLVRQERGEQPDPEEYAARYPESADLIRRTLAALRVAGGSLIDGRSLMGDTPPVPRLLGDFLISREIGRGGMGVVYEAEQITLRRRVAVKALPFAAVMDPRHLQRFRNEALAAASLDHPHVVKVHAVGCERGIHYIAMQFVDGRPLADLIRERRGEPGSSVVAPAGPRNSTQTFALNSPPDAPIAAPPHAPVGGSSRTPTDAAYARQVAEWGVQAAEALEHAHALGVVHRDVKPANLLVDARGELYVADFGLAKLGGSDPGVTGTGDLLGTPRYMSPEQASARHGLVDHRSDVYSLGATLYELLTLTPAFGGDDRHSILRKIADEDPTPPRKLDRKVPRDLETVVLKCLEKNPNRRYQSAKDLAEDLRRFLADTPVQAKRRTLRERVGRWVRRRPITVAALILAVVVGSGALAVWDRERTLADAAAAQAADEAESFYREGRYLEALAVARQGVDRLPRYGSRGVRDRVVHLAKDITLVHRLEEIRLEQSAARADGSGFDEDVAIPLYREAFLDYGVDVLRGDEEQVVQALQRSTARAEVVAVLLEWRSGTDSSEDREKLGRLVSAVDLELDGVGVEGRGAILARDGGSFRRAAQALNGDSLTPHLLSLVARDLVRFKAREDAIRLLREGLRVHPENFWLNHDLGIIYHHMETSWRSEALRYLTITSALRPLSPGVHLNLGQALGKLGRWDEAEVEFRRAIALKPDYSEAHSSLAQALALQGKMDEVETTLRRAIALKPTNATAHNNLGALLIDRGQAAEGEAELRRAIILEPNHAEIHSNLGTLLGRQGKLAEAEAELRRAIALEPDHAGAHGNLGHALADRGKLAEAEAEYRRAIALEPDYAGAHYNLGNLLKKQGNVDAAEAEYRRAIALKLDNNNAHSNLAILLKNRGKLEEAEGWFRRAIALKPDDAEAHYGLGFLLKKRGKLEDAEVEYRRAIALKPGFAAAHQNLGNVLAIRGNVEGAEREFRRAIELEPNVADTHHNLGNVLNQRRKAAEAEAEYRRAITIKPDHADAHRSLGVLLQKQGELGEAEAEYRRAIALKPDDAEAHYNLGTLLEDRGKPDVAEAEYRRANVLKPDLANSHYNLGLLLKKSERWEEAEGELRQAVALKPDDAVAHDSLGLVLLQQRKWVDAEGVFRRAIELKPDDAAHHNLGLVLMQQRKWADAEGEFRQAFKLKPDNVIHRDSLGNVLRLQGKLAEAEREVRQAIALDPDSVDSARRHGNLGVILREQGNNAEAERAYRRSLQLDPMDPGVHRNLGILLLAERRVPEAEAAFREAAKLNPNYVDALMSLGNLLRDQRRLKEAEIELRRAVESDPNSSYAHYNLGSLLQQQSRPKEAEAEYRRVIEIDPDVPIALYNLGNLLRDRGNLSEAETAFRRAIKIDANYAEAHCNLGGVLRKQGRFPESLVEYQRGHELGSMRKGWSYPSPRWVQEAKRLVELNDKLAAIVARDVKPASPEETLQLLEMARLKKWYATAAKLNSHALAADPNLATRIDWFRYNAACDAALAGCGKGEDAAKLTEDERTALRGQALRWLKEELAQWSSVANDPNTHAKMRETLQDWWEDTDLAGIRDERELKRLTASERAEWRKLWVGVWQLQLRIEHPSKVGPPAPTLEQAPPPRPAKP